MPAGNGLQALKKAGEQRGATPVIDYASAGIDEIEVGPDNDRRLQLARQDADQIWNFRSLDGLLLQAIGGTAGLGE